MSIAAPAASPSRASLATGWTLTVLPVLFLTLDGAMKVARARPVADAAAELGLPMDTMPGIGVLLLACTALFAIPRTAVLGAVLLTGYLGGAISTHVRVHGPVFSLAFPAILGALIWGGLLLREPRLRALFPARR